MVARIATFCSLTASDTLNLLSISCATTSLNLFTVGRSLSPGTRWFFNSSFIQGRSKNKKLSQFHTELLWQFAMAQEQLPFGPLSSTVPLSSVTVYIGFVSHVHHAKQHKPPTFVQGVIETLKLLNSNGLLHIV